jgi:hypothetical protein
MINRADQEGVDCFVEKQKPYSSAERLFYGKN